MRRIQQPFSRLLDRLLVEPVVTRIAEQESAHRLALANELIEARQKCQHVSQQLAESTPLRVVRHDNFAILLPRNNQKIILLLS